MVEKKNQGAGDQQPQEHKFIAGMAQDPTKAAAEAAMKAAMEATLQAAADAQAGFLPVTQNHESGRTLRINTHSSERVVRRNQQDPFTWLESPGTLIFGITSKWKLEDNATARKAPLKLGKITKIRCARFDGEKIIHFWVTDHLDPDGIEVTEVKSGLQANIGPWMFREGIVPDPGIRQKFDLLDSPELILGLPALFINLGKATKTTYFDPSPKKDEEAKASAKDKAKLKKDAPGAPAPKVEDPPAADENE